MLRILLVGLFFWSSFVDDTVGQKHVHDNHPVLMHGGGYFRAQLDGPGHTNPTVKLDSNGNYMIFNEWLINSTCNKVERGNTYSRSVTHKIHVELELEAEWGAEAGAKVLAAELKSYAKARVQLKGGWSGEWKEELSFSSKADIEKCQKIWYVFLKNRRKASGYIHTWEHKITCMRPSNLDVDINYCDFKKLNGTGVGWGTHIGEHVQRGLVKNCPCTEIDPDTKHVFNPTTGVPVPELFPHAKPADEKAPPIPQPEEPEYVLQNPLPKDDNPPKDEGDNENDNKN